MSSTAWATPGLGFDSQGKHIKIKHIPLMHLKPFWIKWYTKWKWKPILFCFRLSIQQYPSSTLALLTSMCFVNCTTGLCNFCINIWHVPFINQTSAMYFSPRCSWKRWFLHSRAVKTRKTHSTASLMQTNNTPF